MKPKPKPVAATKRAVGPKSRPAAAAEPERGLPAAKWLPILAAAGISPPALDDAKTPHAKAIKLGLWLSAKVGREIPVCVRGRRGKAVLRAIKSRSRETQYRVEVTWERAQVPESTPPVKVVKTATKKENPSAKGHAVPKPPAVRKHTTGGNDEEW